MISVFFLSVLLLDKPVVDSVCIVFLRMNYGLLSVASVIIVTTNKFLRLIMAVTKPGEWAMQVLLRQLTSLARSKIEKALEDRQETNLVKSMKLNEDPAYEQLISAFGVVAEFSLPSLVSTLSLWYRSQHSSGKYYQLHQRHCFTSPSKSNEVISTATQHLSEDSNHSFESHPNTSLYIASLPKSYHLTSPDASVLFERRDLAIDIIFCHTMLAILRQLPFHPGHNDVIELILEQCFRRFNYREDLQPKNSENINLVADLYAEIVGLLFQSRFALVRHKFMGCLNDLRAKENSPNNRASIVSLIMGMKFFE
ncbi:unnamed protein product [Heterobilharzia americana]|nr:unnamed protein product [Heterobilharzia americana]